jgi:tetratricopeptide (TPR) repeat protein
MKKAARILLILFVTATILLPTKPARADVAPPPAPGLAGLQPFQYQNTNVQMLYERVEMELLAVTPDDPIYNPDYGETQQKVSVTAWFVMHNQGSKEEKMQVIFPSLSLNDCDPFSDEDPAPPSYVINEFVPNTFTASIDGAPEKISTVRTDNPYKGKGYCDDMMDWYAFDASFPVDKDVLIRVSYIMSNDEGDAIENIEYTLETGAAWKGPIGEAYIIYRSPYLLTDENILNKTTPGYQALHNEIYWHYKNLDPTHQNNIVVSVLSPDTWKEILAYRDRIKNNSKDADAWRSLAQSYINIAIYHGSSLRNSFFDQKAEDTYQQAIAANPNNADLYADYAYNYFAENCLMPTAGCEQELLPYLNKALQLDPYNKQANEILNDVLGDDPSITYTPPPPFTPTDTFTPTITLTPTFSPTPTDTITPTPPGDQYPLPENSSFSLKSYIPTVTGTATPIATFPQTSHTTSRPAPAQVASSPTFPSPWAVTGLLAILLILTVALIVRWKG